ncbi:P-loop containing nucleoside triphosphate hydrolase protein [Cristinia sonorae]|uniref:P-loop containing nucleoside triphosphate hydrolase protein n=1 Tax=Cristinia sonorae TaxID=1940300 RepID=A0A8K0UZE3_9AGAR|nr:P-loop containing nucleoside triphosphate hydrolase protein [Cristinia sonorae]
MPAFESPVAAGGLKRKNDDDQSAQRKRQSGSNFTVNAGLSIDTHWMVQWRNPQTKKHKTWDGDGVLLATSKFCILFDLENRRIAQGKPDLGDAGKLGVGSQLVLGGKELEIDCAIKKEDYLSGKCFTRGGASSPPPTVIRNTGASTKQFVPLRPKSLNNGFKPPSFLQRGPPIAGPSRAAAEVTVIETPVTDVVKSGVSSYWTVNWRKPQGKKNKTWDGDAFLIAEKSQVQLVSEAGIILGSKRWDGSALHCDDLLLLGGREVQLDSRIQKQDLPAISGRSHEENTTELTSSPPTPFVLSSSSRSHKSTPVTSDPEEKPSPVKGVSSTAFYAHVKPKAKTNGPLHDPNAEGAVVMQAPTPEHAIKHNKKNLPVVPVVIDPVLARRLRSHQIEGVKFMYECVMGLKHEGKGCILADEMGMGKTLQTITLVWTLLKQNPYSGIGPVVGKVLIVCPVTLVNNWKSEFHKWLGRDRVGVFVGDKDKGKIKQFINSRIHHVLIIGYERLRTVIDDLAYCIPPIGLIICDEGHRLKSANNKTTTMFDALRTPRRIILSGTPIQNDLGEFHSMADFCNPGLLDNYQKFRKVYEAPILKSRAPGCSAKDKEVGEGRMQELMEIARQFVLRRDASILKNFLPPKYEYVVFITPTRLQRSMFQRMLTRDHIDNVSRANTAESLALINLLTKISNSPILLKATVDQAKNQGDDGVKIQAIRDAVKLLPDRAQIEDVSLSGKLAALANLLRAVYKGTDEKCIVVSHYTSTLNIIEAFCKKKNYSYHRLDGQTPPHKRQEYVNDFNKSSQSQRFIFLLSSKAGGVGLNLIGASRLCLVDSDWNPSHDLQSMARIHRDGQKRPVFIYRFLTAGSIDEKIFQRQVTKLGLSSSLIGDGKSESKSDSFTRKDLQDIFTVHPHTASNTHDLLECPCDDRTAMKKLQQDDDDEDDEAEDDGDVQMGFVNASEVKAEHIEKMDKMYLKEKKAQLASLGEWTHIHCLAPNAKDRIHDTILQKLLFIRPSAASSSSSSAGKGRAVSLLDAVDLDQIMEDTAPPLSVDDVPGGTVSFLFERGQKAPLVEEPEDADEVIDGGEVEEEELDYDDV